MADNELVWQIAVTPTIVGNVTITFDHTSVTGENAREVAAATPITVFGRTTVTVDDAEANESGAAVNEPWLVFTARLADALPNEASVDWETNNGTAMNGRDFEAGSGTLTFAPGETEAQGRVKLFATTRREDDETFTITLSNPVGRIALGDDATGTMTIVDDSLGLALEQPAAARTGDSSFVVPITLRGRTEGIDADDVETALEIIDSGGCETASVVDVTDASGDDKYSAEINPGGTCHIEIGIGQGARLGDSVMLYTARIWIMGSAGFVAEITGNASARENGDRVRFWVSLNAPPVETLTVDYATSDGTDNSKEPAAEAGSDYTAARGTITFEPPAIRQGRPEQVAIDVPLLDDTLIEGIIDEEDTRAEHFTLTLSNPSAGVTIGVPKKGTIQDDEQQAWFDSTVLQRNNKFTTNLNFRVAAPNVSLADIRRVVRLSAGAIESSTRASEGIYYLLTISSPDDNHIEVVLPRGSELGGYTVLNEVRTWLLQPLSASIEDAEGTEGPGETIEFPVRLTSAAPVAITVEYRTKHGENDTATPGSDYTASEGPVTFAPGETLQHISVPILDDDVDEATETFTVILSGIDNGSLDLDNRTAIGSIKNHDELPIALIARFGRATASHVVDQVEARISASPPTEDSFNINLGSGWMQKARASSGAPAGRPGGEPRGMPGLHAGAGHTVPGAPGRRGAGAVGLQRRMPDRHPLEGASFAMSRQSGGGMLSIWTQSARSTFTGQQGDISLGGDVRTTLVGADYSKGRVIAGAALGRSLGTGTYAGVSRGEVRSTMTGLYPWIGYRASERVTVWATAGYGGGRMLLSRASGPQEAPVSMTMTAGGVRSELTSGEGLDLAVKADALWVGTSVTGSAGPNGNLGTATASITRVRTGIEGSRSYTLMGRLALKPLLEVGLRRDGGDADTGAGVDVGTGIVLADTGTGLGIDLRVRTLVMHQAEEFRERSVAMTFTYDPTPTDRGLSARIAPAWGGDARGSPTTLLHGDAMRPLGYRQDGGRVEGEVGYGLAAGRFVGTPKLGFDTSTHGRTWRVGYGLSPAERGGARLELGIELQRNESAHLPQPSHGATGRVTLAW